MPSGLGGRLFPVDRQAGRQKFCLKIFLTYVTQLLIGFQMFEQIFGIVNIVPIDLWLVFKAVIITRLFLGILGSHIQHCFIWWVFGNIVFLANPYY